MTPQEFHNRWYDEARITDTGEAYLLEWLGEQSPDDWHALTLNWNYDLDNAALKWIVSHPECDIGTAIQLFMIGMDSWFGLKREDVRPYYPDAFDATEIARERLTNEDFFNRELIPLVTYSQDEIRPAYPPIIKTYQGRRNANSDFMSQDGTIYLSERAFAEKIGVDYSIIQKSRGKKRTTYQAKPYSKFQITIAIITLFVILLALIFL